MGSSGANGANLGAFLNRIHPEGLDLGRCQIKEALGVYVADPTAVFRAGSLVMRNASGLVVPSNGTDILGVAKWNHSTTMLAVAVDEPIVAVAGTAVALKRGNVSNVRVAAVVLGASAYTVTTDYTVSAANGTVTAVAVGAGGSIPDGSTVYVTYTYQITEADLLTMQGKNFWNTSDEVSMNENRITVITDAELLFTSQYDTTRTYALTGAGSNLYASAAGLFTNDSGGAVKFAGRVFQVPTASDPFLGLRFIKQPLVA